MFEAASGLEMRAFRVNGEASSFETFTPFAVAEPVTRRLLGSDTRAPMSAF